MSYNYLCRIVDFVLKYYLSDNANGASKVDDSETFLQHAMQSLFFTVFLDATFEYMKNTFSAHCKYPIVVRRNVCPTLC